MICCNEERAALMTMERSASCRVIRLERPPLTEYFITSMPADGRSIETLLAHVADVLRRTGARIVSQEVFASVSRRRSVRQAIERALGRVRWPLTWIDSPGARGFAGTQIWAVSGTEVEPLVLEGGVVGSRFEDRFATYCRLGSMVPAHVTRERGTQANEVLGHMRDALSAGHLDFAHTVRTWFYLDDILSWYGDFNAVRDGFFRQTGVFGGLVPASTGIGAANLSGSALVAGLLAARPKNGCVTARAVPSPLQCPALDYGSSFSRAVELDLPDHRRLYVSGTASIAPEGHTLYVGDVDAQIAKTMDVVAAILESRHMGWSDVVRGIVYVKHDADIPAYHRYCITEALPAMPVVVMNSTVCRDNLLFELEVDAIVGK